MRGGKQSMSEVEKVVQKSKKMNGIIRKLDDLGRIVLPKDYRKLEVEDGVTNVAVYYIKDYVIVEILEGMGNKKVDGLGRVVIDIEIRNQLGWNEQDEIEVWKFGKYFVLKKVALECIFCGIKKNLLEYKEKKVCEKCKYELARM